MNRPFATPILAIASVTSPGQMPAVFAGAGDGLAVSRDGCHSWSSCLGGVPISALAVGPTVEDDGLVIAGTAHGVLRSPDWGHTWREVALPGLRSLIAALAFGPDGLIIAGAMEDGLYRSTDGGLSWISANAGAYIPRITAVATIGSATWVAGTTHGAFASDTAGRSWDTLLGIVDDVEVTALAGAGETVILGTTGDGILAVSLRTGGLVTLDSGNPAAGIVALQVAEPEPGTFQILAVTSTGIMGCVLGNGDACPASCHVPLDVQPTCAAFTAEAIVLGTATGDVRTIPLPL